MTGNGSNRRRGDKGILDNAGENAGGAVQNPSAAGLPWLLSEKITIPDQVPGYLHRPELAERIGPTARRITVLKAPGGFGKTTLMVESCRRLKDDGIVAAWLTLDGQETVHVFDAYLTYAFQEAGLDVLQVLDERQGGDRPLEHRTGLLVRAIERHGAPCVLFLDELERLVDPDSLKLLNFLLQWGTPNLHLAVACREIPITLDIASSWLEGHAELLSAEDMRFSKPDIVRFFGSRLSRREVASTVRESSGWPIALRILQNEKDSGANRQASDAADIAENWVESRLWRDFSESDRELLLDVGLFEWIDRALLDEVLSGSELLLRVDGMPALAGLLESVRGAVSDTWRLHPLIREHCAKRRLLETPERFRSVHCRIAVALQRRGETVAAVRHAAQGGDSDLIFEILDEAGGLRLWLREGLVRVQAVDRFVTADAREKHPRLALLHCVVLLMTGRLDEARHTYRATAAKAVRSAPDSDREDIEIQLDDSTVRGMLCMYGCERFDSESVRVVLADRLRFASMPEVDPLTRGSLENGLCFAYNQKAEFGPALDWAERAERSLGGSPYITMFLDLQRGQVAMARGRVAEAEDYYKSAYQIARANFLRDPGPAIFGEILMRELDLERNRVPRDGRTHRIPNALIESGTPLPSYAAASEVAVDVTLQDAGVDEALAGVEEKWAFARRAGLPALVRYLAATRTSLLAIKGRIGDAERAWRLDGLPERAEGCLDLQGQTWREMEAIACARLRLLTASEKFDAGRQFAESLFSVAAERGLRRTTMRGLALSVALERTAGWADRAEDRLVDFLRLFAETDYARPMVREREACEPVLTGLLEDNPDPSIKDAAERLRDTLNGASDPAETGPRFSVREMEVLVRLGSQRNREIASALELSEAGVRYHIGNIFAKLQVRSRRDAVRRAREIGVLAE